MTTRDPSQQRVALVTGGTDGIGRAVAKRLLADGWRVVITARSAERAETVCDALARESGSDAVTPLVADLSKMRDVASAAARFSAEHTRLDLLLLNANAITHARTLTDEGFEANLAVGYVGRALLARSLEGVLAKTSGAQVLTVVGLNLDRLDFDDPSMAKGFSSGKALGRWQWSVQVFSRAWNARGAPPMNVFMPGLVRTKILASEPQPMRLIVQVMNALIGISPERSADEVAQAVERAGREGLRDAYFARTKVTPKRALNDHPEDAARLVALTDAWLAPFEKQRG